MNEDFVPFELAVKLQEKGFNEPCYGYYHCGGGDDSFEVCGNGDRDFLNSKNKHRIAAPTISQVLKWLREEKKIYVSILPFATHSTINKVAFYYLIEYNSTGETMKGIEQNTYCAKWNDAAFAGIEYTLDNLI